MVPISRMGLSIVISQYLYIMYMLGSSRQMHLFTTFAQIKEGLAGLVIMLTIGLVIYLLFEAPVVNLLFDLVGSKRGQKEMVKPRKLRVDLAEFKDENGNLKPEYEKWSSCNGQSWSPCSPDIEQKQL